MRTEKLNQLSACYDAIEWVKTRKSPKDAWMNCIRGDWMLWLAKKLDVDDRKLTLTKAMCAKQVEYLMKDQRSKDALDACFKYANGLITRKKLDQYAADAYAAYTTTYDDAAAAAAYAAAAAAYAAAYADAAYADAAAAHAAYAAYVYAAYVYAADADNEAKTNSLKKSADICREILTDEVLLKYKKLRKK